MARVTVEDCVLKVPNRFDLVMLAAQRARDISAGAPLTLDRDNDKNPVVALREIADETVELGWRKGAAVGDEAADLPDPPRERLADHCWPALVGRALAGVGAAGPNDVAGDDALGRWDGKLRGISRSRRRRCRQCEGAECQNLMMHRY